MEIRFQGKTYNYNKSTHQVFNSKGVLVRNQDQMIKIVEHFKQSMNEKGFNLKMDYNEFDNYISILSSKQKSDLFHNIYENYDYASSLLSDDAIKKPSQTEYFKIMAKIKRYEQYLYKIIKS